MVKIKPIWSQWGKLKQSDIALSFLLASDLSLDEALNRAKVKMLIDNNEIAKYDEKEKEYYFKLLDNEKMGRPAGRAREQLYKLIQEGYLKEVKVEKKDQEEETDNKMLRMLKEVKVEKNDRKNIVGRPVKKYRLSVDYYFDKFKPNYSEETKVIIRKFFSEPKTSFFLFYDFNCNWRNYPIVSVGELVETIIETSLWFYEEIAYVLYESIPTRGFLHVPDKESYTKCSRPNCSLDGRYHFHNKRQERSDEIKEALRKIVSDRLDDEIFEAAGKVISLSMLFQNRPSIEAELAKFHPYNYYFILGRLLTKKGFQNRSYQFLHGIDIAYRLKPMRLKEEDLIELALFVLLRRLKPIQLKEEDIQKIMNEYRKQLKPIQLKEEEGTACPECNTKRIRGILSRDYCQKCGKFASDEELCVDQELITLLDKLYLNERIKKLKNFYQETK